MDGIITFRPDEAIHRLYERALATGIRKDVSDPRVTPCHTSSRGPQRLKPTRTHQEIYDVVVVGAGPAGLVLSVLLARYGLREKGAVLCVEPLETPVPAGHADGLTCRSLEMFKELGLYESVMRVGHPVSESVTWTQLPGSTPLQRLADPNKYMSVPGTEVPPMMVCPQGQVERILEEELGRYAPHTLERGSKVISVCIDDDGIDDDEDDSHPVVAQIKDLSGRIRVVRCKFLVGADGAHSTVRASMGISMTGAPRDQLWGVIDFCPDTNYPDIRRHGHVHGLKGRLMHIPREQNNEGDWLARFYVDMNHTEHSKFIGKDDRARRSQFSPEQILRTISDTFHPYHMRLKAGTKIDWFSAYSVGRRVATEFASRDAIGLPRVFLVGDACHLHSPKLGQGMNMSMADSYNLAWKLTHVLLGVTNNAQPLLDSYVSERRGVAQQLLDIDERWYQFEWAQRSLKSEDNYSEKREELLASITGFLTGYGVQYNNSFLTIQADDNGSQGRSRCFSPGSRIKPMALERFADGLSCNLLHDLHLDGRWKVLLFTSSDLLCPNSRSKRALRALFDDLIPGFPPGTITPTVITPGRVDNEGLNGHLVRVKDLDWNSFPSCVKREAEMKTYFTTYASNETHELDIGNGMIVVVRPEGVVSMVVDLDDVSTIGPLAGFLKSIIRAI